MAGLTDITNTLPPDGRRGGRKQPHKAAAQPAAPAVPTPTEAPPAQPQQQQQPAAAQEDLELEQVDEFLRSFRKLSFEAQPAAGEAAGEQQPPLAGEDSAASSATGTSSQLGSPLAAFAAAKARLERSNSDADSLISAWRRQPAPDAATPAGAPAAARARLLARLPTQAAPRATSALAGGATAAAATALLRQRNLLPQHQRQHSLLLRERLASTMQLCQTLHEQNRANMQKVRVLWSENQRLSRSLQEARLDKEALQATIRSLTREAALLAEQAQRVLLPAPPAQPPAAALASSAPAAGRSDGLSLVRDWSQALSLASGSSGSSGGRQAGAAWQPGTSVRSFEPGSLPGGAAAAPCAQPASADGPGDKRRKLAPGMLVTCLRPSIAAAVAEAAEMDAACGPGGSCHLTTPGRTPKRKLRGSSSQPSGGTPVAAAPVAAPEQHQQEQQPAAAPAPVQPQAAAAAAPEEAAPEEDWQTFQLLERRWLGATPEKAQAPRAGGASRSSRGGVCSIM